MGKICVILQPTFLPWIGWFDLADQADTIILLDDVPFSRQSWQQRNRIRTHNGLEYVTVSVKTSGLFGPKISECKIIDEKFIRKFMNTIKVNYSKSNYCSQLIFELEEVITAGYESKFLADLNCTIIDWMLKKLKIDRRPVRSSTLNIAGVRGEHVAKICEYFQAEIYLSPVGAKDYLLEDSIEFERRNVSIFLQDYKHPEYSQCFTPIIPYASALDLIFNAGPLAGTIMRSGRHSAKTLI